LVGLAPVNRDRNAFLDNAHVREVECHDFASAERAGEAEEKERLEIIERECHAGGLPKSLLGGFPLEPIEHPGDTLIFERGEMPALLSVGKEDGGGREDRRECLAVGEVDAIAVD
jgi:hypothetical protein